MVLNKNEVFTNKGWLEKGLESIVDKKIKNKNKDVVVVVTGQPGIGKTALTSLIGNFLIDDFSEHNLVYTAEEVSKAIESWPKRSFINIDEGMDVFYRRNAMTKENKEAYTKFMKYRFKNHLIFINFQELKEMEPNIWRNRADLILRCVSQGWFHVYNKQDAKRIKVKRNNGVKYVDWPDPGFVDGFPNPEKVIPEIWSSIEKSKDERLGREESSKDDKNSVIPNEPVYSIREVAEKLSLSKQTINNWLNQGKIDALKVSSSVRIPESEIEKIISKR